MPSTNELLRCVAVYVCGVALLATASTANAQYSEVFSEAEAIDGQTSNFLHNVTVSGGIAYALLQVSGGTDGGELVAYDGTDFTTVMTSAQWAATGSLSDPFAINGSAVVGGVLRHVHSLDSVVYEIDLGTGLVSTAVDNLTLSTGADQAPFTARLPAAYDVTTTGDIYAFNDPIGGGHQVLLIDSSNNVSVEIPTADLAAAFGGSTTATVAGITFADGNLFFGSNTTDEITAWDVATDTATVALTTAQIEAVTDDIDGRAGFGDFFYAPDGLVYFYETDADYILSFDPADPSGTIDRVLTEAQLIAGPAGSDIVGQLAWWDGNLAWTRGSFGFYAVPEPAAGTLALLGLLGVAGVRRSR